MEKEIKYALGYYDAVTTHLMTESEIPKSKDSITKLLSKLLDESSCFEEAIINIGLNFIADEILKGE